MQSSPFAYFDAFYGKRTWDRKKGKEEQAIGGLYLGKAKQDRTMQNRYLILVARKMGPTEIGGKHPHSRQPRRAEMCKFLHEEGPWEPLGNVAVGTFIFPRGINGGEIWDELIS